MIRRPVQESQAHIHLPQWPCTVDRAHRTEEANDTIIRVRTGTQSDPDHSTHDATGLPPSLLSDYLSAEQPHLVR